MWKHASQEVKPTVGVLKSFNRVTSSLRKDGTTGTGNESNQRLNNQESRITFGRTPCASDPSARREKVNASSSTTPSVQVLCSTKQNVCSQCPRKDGQFPFYDAPQGPVPVRDQQTAGTSQQTPNWLCDESVQPPWNPNTNPPIHNQMFDTEYQTLEGIDGLDNETRKELLATRQTPCVVARAAYPSDFPGAPLYRPKVMFAAPPFEGTAVFKGEFREVKLSDYRGRYLCLFFYPLDFTFVCPTEILAMDDLFEQFRESNCALLGCSCDSQFTHLAYTTTPKQKNGLGEINFPLLSDYTKTISASYNVLTDEGSPQRALFIIDPLGIIRHITVNDAGVGRNTNEVLRLVQAIKRTDDFDEMCPHGWIPGAVTVLPTRVGALAYYREMYNENNECDDQEEQNHVNYQEESTNML